MRFMPAIAKILPSVQPIERRNMNVWEDDAVRAAVAATGRRRLFVAGLLTEACVSFTHPQRRRSATGNADAERSVHRHDATILAVYRLSASTILVFADHADQPTRQTIVSNHWPPMQGLSQEPWSLVMSKH